MWIMRRPLPTPEELRALLRYEPATGKLYWLPRPARMFKTERDARLWNARFAGGEALVSVSPKGYMYGSIYGRSYVAHRVIWVLVHGREPAGDIDHINGVTDDNRPHNLRDVSPSINQRNRKMQSNNGSGCNGVSWDKARCKWRAYVRVGKDTRHLGRFDDIDDAIAARKDAERGLGFTERHGAVTS